MANLKPSGGDISTYFFTVAVAGTLMLYNTVSSNMSSEVMAWIYPGHPSCNALAEYSDGRIIDILKPQYFSVDENGNLLLLTEGVAGCNGYSQNNVALVKKYSKSQYFTVSASSLSGMDAFIRNELGSGTGVSTLVKFAVDNNLDGVEIDFEKFNSWSADQYYVYRQFIQKLGNELHRHNKKLMIDGPAVSNTQEESNMVWRYRDFAYLPVDKIVIMAYDYQYSVGPGAPVTPLYWLRNIVSYVSSQYPNKEKLSIGLPSYGYKGDALTGSVVLLTGDQIKNEPGFTSAVRDNGSYEMTWKSGERVYYFQDSQSMAEKLRVVEQAGIRSVSIWHLGGNPWFLNK